jgi:uncharacterized phage protein gp47/JayE
MAWSIRSLADGSARLRGAFRQYMPGTDSALRNNFVTVTVKVLAALAHEFELRMAYLSQQMFLATATGQYLVMLASDVGIYRKPASPASGAIRGTGTPGVTYPAGIRFVSGTSTYLSIASALGAGTGELVIAVRSEEFSATANRDVDGVLTFTDPVLWPDLSREWLVTAGGIGGGADAEGDESLRTRALQRKRNPPGGGTLADYERVASSVPGVAKAWAYRDTLSPGFIVVFFLFEGRVNSIPEASDVATVQAAIDAERLIRVDDNVVRGPIPHPVEIYIAGLSVDTDDLRSAISVNLQAMLRDRCRPGIPVEPFTLSRSWISETISQTVGENSHVLVSPSSDIVLTNGEFPVLGAITYGA